MVISTKHCLLIALFVAFFSGITSAQTIKGTVTEESSGKPLPGVNVYLSGTTFGHATDNNGNYILTPSAAGRYDLVFSFVGYKKEIRQLELRATSSITVDVEIEQNVEELEEIKVVSSNKEWREQYEFFFDQFIGRTSFARQTSIENRWELDFTESDNKLIASTLRPLTVTNRALGYKIYLELILFEWPKYRNEGGVYKVYDRYEELMPKSDEELHRWRENRIKAYMGSFQHFLKSLYEDKLNENHFSLDGSYKINPLTLGETKYKLLSMPGTTPGMRDRFKGFELTQRLDVEYDRLVTYRFKDESHRISITKQSGVAPNYQSRTFFVDEKGSLLDPLSLKVFGSWARDRVANSLPSNYSFED